MFGLPGNTQASRKKLLPIIKDFLREQEQEKLLNVRTLLVWCCISRLGLGDFSFLTLCPTQEVEVLRKQVDHLSEENGKLVGHKNHKQRIEYLVKLKKENSKLQEVRTICHLLFSSFLTVNDGTPIN